MLFVKLQQTYLMLNKLPSYNQFLQVYFCKKLCILISLISYNHKKVLNMFLSSVVRRQYIFLVVVEKYTDFIFLLLLSTIKVCFSCSALNKCSSRYLIFCIPYKSLRSYQTRTVISAFFY